MDTKFEDLKKVLAPAGVQVNSNYIKIGDKLAKTLFIFTYPRFLSTGWFEPIINQPSLFDISIYINPIDTALALKTFKRKVAEVESQLNERMSKGLVRDPVLETAYSDIESLRDALQQAREKLFSVGVYITIYSDTLEDLKKLEELINSTMESKIVYLKPAIFQELEAFMTNLPTASDKIGITNQMNTGPLSSFFPFVSEELTSDTGVLYGINRHNNTLILFDRFSLENANLVVFAKSGAGKSYASKLEIIRNLMMGTDILIIDPENEYKKMADGFGGSFFNISLASEDHINPFDIPVIPEGEDPTDVLRSHIVNVSGLIKLMLGKLSAEEDSILDEALIETYSSHEIVAGKDFTNAVPPLLSDLENVLRNIEGGKNMAERLYKYTKGSFSGFVNQPTNVDLSNRLIVFSIRDLEEELRPIAMYLVMNYIWNTIRAKLKKRILVIDEAWVMMKYESSAIFLFGLVKRARKYYLGITTITQEVDDFMNSPYGRPIVTNSAIQLLLKQSPTAMPALIKAFNLTEAEQSLLLQAEIGTGLFSAGPKHVAIQIIASPFEDKIITTNPQQLLEE
ncbi:MAG: ATP-binding protein [Patescibacteria group bacterium]|nr:ATP-binding protein [Patescibacteria group bacterium]